jgi:hypothetical protein
MFERVLIRPWDRIHLSLYRVVDHANLYVHLRHYSYCKRLTQLTGALPKSISTIGKVRSRSRADIDVRNESRPQRDSVVKRTLPYVWALAEMDHQRSTVVPLQKCLPPRGYVSTRTATRDGAATESYFELKYTIEDYSKPAILEVCCEAEDRDQCRALVNAVINLRVP